MSEQCAVAAVRSGFSTMESSFLAAVVNRAFTHIEHINNRLAFCAWNQAMIENRGQSVSQQGNRAILVHLTPLVVLC